jgi:predicted 3-demethylubiquinone-9 3-methyltransferase (glyoxalase superfamily)
MRTLYPCLWFDGNAEEAANFYTSLLPDSRVDRVWRSPADTPSGPAGMVLTVDFTLAGQPIQASTAGRISISTKPCPSLSSVRTKQR